MKRAVVFAHFDAKGVVDDYVLDYLVELKKNSNHLIFVSTASLNEVEVKKITTLANEVVVRPNAGYDFMSWSVGIQRINLRNFEEVVICNDSVYGPFYPLNEVFDKFENAAVDFWGITRSYEIAEHVQSYFMVFKSSCIKSMVFENFWKSIEIESSKLNIIKKYEVGITQKLLEVGLRYQTLVNISRVDAAGFVLDKFWYGIRHRNALIASNQEGELRHKIVSVGLVKNVNPSFKKIINIFIFCGKVFVKKINPTHLLWRKTLKMGSPFLKIELLAKNPSKVSLEGWSDVLAAMYPNFKLQNVKKHLNRF